MVALHRPAILLVAVLALPPPAWGEATTELAPGTRVRVTHPKEPASPGDSSSVQTSILVRPPIVRTSGPIAALRPATIVILPDRAPVDSLAIAWSAVRQLETSRGMKGNFWRGYGLGLVGALGAGVVYSVATGGDESGDSGAHYGGAIFVLIPVLAGVIWGIATKSERWRDVPRSAWPALSDSVEATGPVAR